jgi:hypothetical protein
MSFFDFDFIENFFFVSLGITFVLIMLLVYHFKQRITSMERKGDTMYELITNVVKELQFMKKLNAYYETLFQNTGLSVEENPVKEPANNDNEDIRDQNVGVIELSGDGLLSKDIVLVADSVVSPTTNNIVMNLNDNPPQPKESHINSRIVVSEDESSVSDDDEESDSDETDLNYSTTDDDTEEDEYIEKPEEPTSIANMLQIVGGDDLPSKDNVKQSPIEMNSLMEMIQQAFTTGMAIQEPPKFAPYYEDEISQTNTYKPVILHDEERLEDEPIVDVLDIVQVAVCEAKTPDVVSSGLRQVQSETRTKDLKDYTVKDNGELQDIDSVMVELDVSDLEDFLQQPPQFSFETPNVVSSGIPQFSFETPNVVSSGIPQFSFETPNVVSPGIPQISSKDNAPVPPVDKKQTREVYRKMNITQLRGIATAAGITVDTTKMKKNELIQLLENLEE